MEERSQEKKILKFLMGGGSVTTLEALRMFNCLRLSARIYRLRVDGWKIRDRWVTLENKKRVKQYFI